MVACAAVCRLWRDTMKLPGPRGEPMQCFIRRDRDASIYRLYLGLSPALAGDVSKLLLATKKVRKATGAEFLISLAADDFSRATNTYLDMLDSTRADVVKVVIDVSYNYDVPYVFHILAHTKENVLLENQIRDTSSSRSIEMSPLYLGLLGFVYLLNRAGR
ncbi:tubby-like F-box protein 5 [Tanacetum coccineum]